MFGSKSHMFFCLGLKVTCFFLFGTKSHMFFCLGQKVTCFFLFGTKATCFLLLFGTKSHMFFCLAQKVKCFFCLGQKFTCFFLFGTKNKIFFAWVKNQPIPYIERSADLERWTAEGAEAPGGEEDAATPTGPCRKVCWHGPFSQIWGSTSQGFGAGVLCCSRLRLYRTNI